MRNIRIGNRLARLLPLIAAVALAGCGGDGGDGSAGTPPVASYSLSGTVSHLDAAGLIISDGTETLAVPQGATSFAFVNPLSNGSAYTVTVTSQPAGENCTIGNASDSVGGAAVANVAITCNTRIAQPVTLGVLPSVATYTGTRILLPVTQVGTAPTTINAILDTGSSGTLLRASDVFPDLGLSESGFTFPPGQTSMTRNGVTVTNLVVTRKYGDDTTELTGNLGFAQITFGQDAHVTTATMPILLVFKRVTTKRTPTPSFGNVIGVNAMNAPIGSVGGVPPTGPAPPCTPQSTTSCGLPSPFRYLNYADGIDKGFVLKRVTLTDCDTTKTGSCPISPNLTIGVTAPDLAAFSTYALPSCTTATIFESLSEPVCKQDIPSVMVSSGGYSFAGSMIFDTGTPSTNLLVPQGMTFPFSLPVGSTVRIQTPSGFVDQYMTGTGYLSTSVETTTDGSASNSGIGFFTRNSFLYDYSKALVGWRTGS